MIIYVVYMYTIEEEKQILNSTIFKISSITMRYRIRTQSDLLAVEMKIRKYLKNKNIDNVKDIIILNWKDISA